MEVILGVFSYFFRCCFLVFVFITFLLFWDQFWMDFDSILGRFWSSFWDPCWDPWGDPFWIEFGPFREHFPDERPPPLDTKIDLQNGLIFGCQNGAKPILENNFKMVPNMTSTRVSKMNPKTKHGFQNYSCWEVKHRAESILKRDPTRVPKRILSIRDF